MKTSRMSRMACIGLFFLSVLTASFFAPALAQDTNPPPAAEQTNPNVTSGTNPSPQNPPPDAQGESAVSIYVPDGQLKSHPLRIYITKNITQNSKPTLLLLRGHAFTEKSQAELQSIEPFEVAPNQAWTQTVAGQLVPKSGTLLLFDISNMDFNFKAMIRVRPVISWTENGVTRKVVSAEGVNVADIISTVVWTLIVLAVALGSVLFLSWRQNGSPLYLLTGAGGHLSLAQTQTASWTVAVGSIVFGYGLIRFEIPDIPESLLVLMGASLTTGGVGFFQDQKKQIKAGAPAVAKPRPALGDLIRTYTPGQADDLSLAKAQMLFWTILLLVLFVAKSILDGAIWEVPWALVALLGFSQAGYLAPKLVDTTSPGGQPPTPGGQPPAPGGQPQNPGGKPQNPGGQPQSPTPE